MICSSLIKDSYNYCNQHLPNDLQDIEYHALKINSNHKWDFTVEKQNHLSIKKFDINDYKSVNSKPIAQCIFQFDNVESIHMIKISKELTHVFVVDDKENGRLYKLDSYKQQSNNPLQYQTILQARIYQIISLENNRLIIIRENVGDSKILMEAYLYDNRRTLKLIVTKDLNIFNPYSELFI